MVTKKDLFKIRPVTYIEKVEVTELPGVTLGIKMMSCGEYEEYEHSLFNFIENEDGSIKPVPIRKDTRLKLLLFSVCDPDSGELIFSKEDLPKLREWPNTVISSLYVKARDVNRLQEPEAGKEKN